MAHCMICRKDFASSASLRTHRSRFHRPATETDQMEVESQETDKTGVKSQETDQTDVESQDGLQTDDESQKDSADHQDTLSSKRRHVKSQTTDDEEEKNPYPQRARIDIFTKSSQVFTIF